MSEPSRTLQHLAGTSAESSSGSGNTGTNAGAAVPRPRSRWVTRYVVPLAIIAASVGMIAYAARDVLTPAIEVDVAPVVVKAAALERDDGDDSPDADGRDADSARTRANAGREPTVIAQAPGWIEPDPYAITVPALEPGVVREVLVLEGDNVEEGDVLVRLVDDDTRLAVEHAQARLAVLEAARDRADAGAQSAAAHVDEVRDEVQRKRPLVEHGGVSQGEFTRLELRLRRIESEHVAAQAAVKQAEAQVAEQRAAIAVAELALSRMVIRAPMDGVVLSRSVTPGSRIAPIGDGLGEMHMPGVATLYDPARLQVRADVALADAARVAVGIPARISTDALPDQTFTGVVTRIIHRADIQRNTVKVKVRIDDPSPVLKPDMICRVRLLSDDPSAGGSGGTATSNTGGSADVAGGSTLRIFAPADGMFDRSGERGRAWVIEPSDRSGIYRARLRELTLGASSERGDVLVRSGLRPGDRVILDPPEDLSPDAHVRIRGNRRIEPLERTGDA